MVRKGILVGAVALLAGTVQAAELDMSSCVFPEEPVVPNGATASEEEMGEASQAVRAYVTDVQDALECLTTVEQNLGDDITDEQRTNMVSAYNQGVDRMNAAANSFNEEVRAFKAR